jgi:iron complex transport system substrate-binding protein
VSLAPSNTEIAHFLGLTDRVVGVCDDSDFPAELAGAARVGMDLQIDADRVAALKPDLVLASLSVPGMERCVKAVEEKGLATLTLDPKRLEDVFRDIEAVGRAAGVPGRAAALNASLRGRLAAVERSVAGLERPTVWWEWWPRPLISPGARSWMVDIVRVAGGRMLFDDVDRESFTVGEERVLLQDPEVAVLCWCGTLQRKQDPAKLAARPGWANVRAVADGRVFAVDEAYFGRPGPRLVDGAELLAKVFHPGKRG